MKYVYKQVKVQMPHCPTCKEQLTGNGSIAYPYCCSCGIWKPNWVTHEYIIVPKQSLDANQDSNP